jgi:hypothetical protein
VQAVDRHAAGVGGRSVEVCGRGERSAGSAGRNEAGGLTQHSALARAGVQGDS